MERMRQIQQGDVLLQQVASVPSDATRVPSDGAVVIARGERSGHRHVIKSDQAALWSLARDGVTELYLEVRAPVTIVHDEHRMLPIPPGIYRVGRVKEYDYFAQMERRIED